jgi:hypothetical protein
MALATTGHVQRRLSANCEASDIPPQISEGSHPQAKVWLPTRACSPQPWERADLQWTAQCEDVYRLPYKIQEKETIHSKRAYNIFTNILRISFL